MDQEDKYTLGYGIFAQNTPLAGESGINKWPLQVAHPQYHVCERIYNYRVKGS